MSVLSTIAEIEKSDVGTARLLLELALYDAVCDEIDRVRDDLETDVRKAMGQQAARGLVHLARQPVSKASIELADQLVDLVSFAKADDDPKTPWYDARDERGRFRRSIFNALGFATGPKDQQMSGRATAAAGAWAGPSADSYSRLRSLGQGLVATNDPTARAAGTVLQLTGDIGREAQTALEPGLRRSAYRYRGTERRPRELLQRRAAALAVGAEQASPAQLKERGHASGDQARLRILSGLGASELISQIPDKDTAAISLAAGKMPPSVGLMFDGQGRLVSEAMGFNGDHYLPFDLKNLKRLKGGSYVRTRTTGGLTDEDVYTGLMTGARHLTVVSNSGVFTLEFDPALRGGRRYSDKARQMVDRYSRLVGAIGSKELYQNRLPQAQAQEMRQKALADEGGNAERADALFKRREKEALAAAAFAGFSDDDLREQAEAEVRAHPKAKEWSRSRLAKEVEDVFREKTAAAASTSARVYRLDGQGYEAAMKALKAEFPYFIREASFTPLQRYMDMFQLGDPNAPRRPRGGTDMGYTPRGGADPIRAGSLGAPKVRQSTSTAAPKESSERVPSSSAAPTAGAANAAPSRRSVQAVTSALLADKKVSLASALQSSLRLRRSPMPNAGWADAFRENGELAQTEKSILDEANPDAYADWLIAKHDGSWAKISEFLTAPGTDPRHLDKALDAVDMLRGIAESEPSMPPTFTAEGFKRAAQELKQARVLKTPFRQSSNAMEAPEPGEMVPPGLPEVLKYELTADSLARVGADPELEQAFKVLGVWSQAGQNDEETAAIITREAERYRKLKTWADDGMDQDAKPIGTISQRDYDDAEAIMESGEKSAPAERLKALNRAWALKRMGELLTLTGAADPFAKGLGPRSTASPSRVVLYSRDSPVAKMLASRSQPAPSLRPVRLPVSR